MTLTEDMAKLIPEFVGSWDVRTASIAGIRVDTSQMLRDSHEARETMAAEQDERLKAEVAARQSDVAEMLRNLADDHAAMAAEQDARLAQDFSELRRDVAAMRVDLDKAHAAMAKEQDKRLKADYKELRRDVAALLVDLDKEHAAMAAEQAARLTEDRAHMAAEVAASRDELRSDIAGAHETWASLKAAMTQRRKSAGAGPKKPAARKAAVFEPIAPAAAPAPAREVAPESVVFAPESTPAAGPVHDDLTLIRGIGEGMQARLNELGIFSFAQLIKADTAEVRDGLGDAGRMARIDEWIEQAEELSSTGG